jgi:phosphate transport system substrate-binding protein
MRKTGPIVLAALAALLLALPAAAADLLLNGAGATFPYPLYSKWFYEYSNSHPGVKFNYQSIGSGGGIKQVTARTVDFGATDAPMTDEELKGAPGKILHFPMTIGAVSVVYNLEGVKDDLKLDPATLSGIFLGTITKWNDPRIVALNKDAKLPDLEIVVAHRSDGSGTTDIFTSYLAAVSPDFKAKVGRGKAVKWPVGLGGKGNEGVAGTVKQTPGAVGYVELAYAKQNRMKDAMLKNREGRFVSPSIESTTEAAAGVAKSMPADFRTSLVDAPGKGSYPISGLTWILVYADQKDAAKGKALVQFLKWAVKDGQRMTTPLLYSPLPKAVAEKVDQALRQVKAGGKEIY